MRTLTSLEAGAAGGFGGVCSIIASQPLDVTKVLMQQDLRSNASPSASPSLPRRSGWQTAAKVVRTSGVRGLYAGMLLPAVGVVPVFSVMFGVYDAACKRLVRARILWRCARLRVCVCACARARASSARKFRL